VVHISPPATFCGGDLRTSAERPRTPRSSEDLDIFNFCDLRGLDWPLTMSRGASAAPPDSAEIPRPSAEDMERGVVRLEVLPPRSPRSPRSPRMVLRWTTKVRWGAAPLASFCGTSHPPGGRAEPRVVRLGLLAPRPPRFPRLILREDEGEYSLAIICGHPRTVRGTRGNRGVARLGLLAPRPPRSPRFDFTVDDEGEMSGSFSLA
jgi:hypothetical protein